MLETPPRVYLLQRLREELLGPKKGSDEQLPLTTDPREEYTTGVLDVADPSVEVRDEIDELEPPPPEISDGLAEDEEDELDPLFSVAAFAPAMDPRRLPCSIGLTFFVQADSRACLEICASAGRYSKNEGGWQRRSQVWSLPPLPMKQWNENFEEGDSGLRVSVRAREEKCGVFRVSVYLLNLGNWAGQTKERPSRFLYQPQLRICLGDGTKLQGLVDGDIDKLDREEKRMQLLYRNSPVMARGHMCAAVWREIDPEQELESPFDWIDRQPHLQKFSHCDLRTELLPMLTVPTPVADWRETLGTAPELSAMKLSDSEQEALPGVLKPLVLAYERWLEEQHKESASLPESYRKLAEEQLASAREVLARIRDGIELLGADRETYLAFCFANRAVAEQASWSNSRELHWRPFQLGFFLLCLRGLSDPTSTDRTICDLLWFPTGGGKTEAYLALTAFTLGLRRLRHPGYDGVGVLSRYTLRLLSIQQFRRALKLITACEMLRVHQCGEVTGWRPTQAIESGNWLWGRHRFSAGLWLGSSVTPNQLEGVDFRGIPGGFNLLQACKPGQSDPAQVTECPACQARLSFPDDNENESEQAVTLHLRVKGVERSPSSEELSTKFVSVLESELIQLTSEVSSLRFVLKSDDRELDIDSWWGEKRRLFGENCAELCVRASRPGYYIETVTTSGKGKPRPQRIELFCPNPQCPTSRNRWREVLPMTVEGHIDGFQPVPLAVASEDDRTVALQCPIPALTVDEQLYASPPSLLVSTVDKFARLAFESRAAGLFGNVEYYHAHEGFYRQNCLSRRYRASKSGHPPHKKLRIEVSPLPPPDLIIQDELHLIDGPLGSMVGLYESAVSQLSEREHPLKYVASTATVREAADQVKALFARELRQFPPPSLDANDSFFALMQPTRVLQKQGPGRLYLGYSAPGRGAVTPQVRVWAIMLQAAEELRLQGATPQELDPYWSPVGYFTTIRNLAAAGSLWRQGLPLRLAHLAGKQKREISPAPLELSSRISSSRLPGLLNQLSRPFPHAVDGVLSTSMFGTGVDVSRLSLMLVHGQPKTTSAYIQATGRVGRESPGLIVTLLPATNPRSLDHYEFFTGYHRQLYRGVEPVTVYPFAPRARERALGPLCVALLRQSLGVHAAWREREAGARHMAQALNSEEVMALMEIFEQRAQVQPENRRPDRESLLAEVDKALRTWYAAAENHSDLVLEEYTLAKPPESPVVLGSPQHETAKLPVVFSNAPQSLRNVEPTTGFKI